VNAAVPKLAPCTVTLADPVVATFVRRTELLVPESNEKLCDLLPTFCDVTDIWRLPITPSPVWQRTDVSDSQTVLSHVVSPSPDPTVYVASPMLAPCTVTLADPVDAAFLLRTTLNRPTSALYPCERLPKRNPLVIATLRLPLRLCPARHPTDVSASQVVRSQPVRPTITDEVCAPAPMLAPCIVMLAEPLAAPFVRLTALASPTSTLCAVLTLPTRPPVVSSTRRLPKIARLERHRSEESASQLDRSHVVRPTLSDTLYVSCPMLEPCTVTLAVPVAPRLARCAILSPPASAL
jgi:hypothetical protein